MASRATKSLLKDKCQHCGRAITRNNIKKHEEKCSKAGTRDFKADFSGSNKDFLQKVIESLEVEQYIIAEEKGCGNFIHSHVYMKTKNNWLLDNLSGVIRVELENYQPQTVYLMNVETTRNAKKWIKYCTKEDTDPIVSNIDLDLCHDNFLMFDYIKNHETLNPFDYGVNRYQTAFKKRRLEEWHATYWDSKIKKARFEHADHEIPKGEKHDEWLQKAKNSTKKGVYIWGPAGTGKSQLVWSLTEGDCYLVPNSGKRFCLATCKPIENAIVWATLKNYYNIETLSIIQQMTGE